RQPVSNAEINRELVLVGRLFRAAKIPHMPTIPKQPESEARSGVFTKQELDDVCSHLPDGLSHAAQFAFLTGWRLREVLDLTWDRVDFDGRGRVWLDGSVTKNGRPRKFPMTTELRSLMDKRKA